MIFRAGNLQFDLSRKLLLLGIVNVTPDSFSDGGDTFDAAAAIAAGLRLVEAGADVLDIGGESTRPGAAPVAAAEELERVVPVIEGLRRRTSVPISIDTTKAVVARSALAAGAEIINDISGFLRDPEMAAVAAETKAGCIAMHMRGTPETMQQFTDYRDLIGEINEYFRERVDALLAAGVDRERICLDPGIGFSKTVEQNLALINRLDEFVVAQQRPILLAPSRKSFIGKLLKLDHPKDRVWGTAAAVSCGIMRGARLVRVHDVAAMRQVCDLALPIALATAATEDDE